MTFTINELTEESNKFKDIFLKSMKDEGIINEKQHGEMSKYSIILAKKSFLGRTWDKLWNKDDDSVNIIVVKVLG